MPGEMQSEIHGEVRVPGESEGSPSGRVLCSMQRHVQVARDVLGDKFTVAFIDELIAAVNEHQRCLFTKSSREVPQRLVIGQAFYDRFLSPLLAGVHKRHATKALELFEADLGMERWKLLRQSRRAGAKFSETVTMSEADLGGIFATVNEGLRRAQ